jgi:hypothetical protein
MPRDKNKDHHSERQSDPETPAHFDEFLVWPGVGHGHHGLERHATYRAGAGADLSHLRMHGTRVDNVERCHRKPFGWVSVRLSIEDMAAGG